MVSYFNGASDSSTIKLIRDIRAKVKTYNNPTWNTNMTIDNLPGVAVVRLYEIVSQIPKTESEALGNGVINYIRGISHPVISYYVGVIDARHSAEFIRHMDLGKNMLLDN